MDMTEEDGGIVPVLVPVANQPDRPRSKPSPAAEPTEGADPREQLEG